MTSLTRRSAVAASLVALTMAGAAACGSSSSGGSSVGTTPTTSSTGSGPSADPAAIALLPASIKSSGVLKVAADASYAPNEFLAANGTTVIGMDADLADAIGKVLGLKVEISNVTFDAIINALQGGRYDLGMSSFTDEKSREKQVNFVDYFKAGTSFFEQASGGPAVTGLSSLCGLKVAVESGTTEETDAEGQSKKCVSAGKPAVDVEHFPTQSDANLALSSNRAQVSMADSPVAAYQVKKSNGAFKLVGTPYGVAPYGIAVPKQDGTLDQAVLDAVKDLDSDGTYTKILDKWGIQAGSDLTPKINGAIF